jgi:hypothetical protein
MDRLSPPGRQGGARPPLVDPVRCRQRNVIEPTHCPAQQHQAIGTKYDMLTTSYHTWLVLAALVLWLPHESSDTSQCPQSTWRNRRCHRVLRPSSPWDLLGYA